MAEADLYPSIQLEASRLGARLFRNNVGTAWQGRITKADGVMLIHGARPVHFGLAEGSGDLIGWVPRVVTADDVGATWAVFVSVEVKAARGRPSSAQQSWLAQVTGSGGVAMIARSVDEFRDRIKR